VDGRDANRLGRAQERGKYVSTCSRAGDGLLATTASGGAMVAAVAKQGRRELHDELELYRVNGHGDNAERRTTSCWRSWACRKGLDGHDAHTSRWPTAIGQGTVATPTSL
jgi:hypothetical protein